MPGSKTRWAGPSYRNRDGPQRLPIQGVVGAREKETFAARWLAYASPCRRFAADLAVDSARLGAGAVRETFTIEDFHLMLLAGLPAHSKLFPSANRAFSKGCAGPSRHFFWFSAVSGEIRSYGLRSYRGRTIGARGWSTAVSVLVAIGLIEATMAE